MKKKVQKINQNRSANSSRQFLVELDLKGLIILLSLALLTGITIFYLGLMFGKATRDPYNLPNKFEQSLSQESVESDSKTDKNLKIYGIHEDSKPKSASQKEFDDLTKKADALLKTASETLDLEVLRSSRKETIKKESSKTSPPRTKQWPDVKKPNKNTVLYTLQILATRQSDKAKGIIKMLKRKGFEAYSTHISIEGTKIYRVRVGKSDKKSIQALKKRLGKSVKGLGKLSLVKIQ